jgi:hypothetical protein
MLRERSAHSWLDTVSTLLGSRHDRPRSPIRRLRVEGLEDRTVLSTAALPMAPAPGMSLDQYMRLEHPMGPIAPPAAATSDASSTSKSSSDSLAAGVISPQSIDQVFGAEGEGEGGGSGSGSGGGSADGSGTGSSSGSGSGSTAGSGSGSTAGSGSGGTAGSGSGSTAGSGSGSGTSSGSGSGGGSGSGSGGSSGSGSSGSDTEDPTISTDDISSNDGVITVNGTIGDDSGLDGLTLTLDNGVGTVTINDDGTFTVTITDPQGYDNFTLTATDSTGNTTTYGFAYSL